MIQKTPRSTNYESWIKEFKPIKNPLTEANFDGFMFETFGEELDYLKDLKKPSFHYWTLIAEGDNLAIISGVRWINRLGYFVTEIPWKEEEPIYMDL